MIWGKCLEIKVEYPFFITDICSAYNRKYDFDFRGEYHDFWEIVCVLDGEVECVEDARVYRLGAGNLVAYAPMEFHGIRNVGSSIPHVLHLSFRHRGELPEKLADGVFCLTASEIEEFEDIVVTILNSYYSKVRNNASGVEATFRIHNFILNLMQRHSPHALHAVSKSASEYRKLIKIMKQNVATNLSLEEIVAIGAMSVSTAKVLFRKYAGIGPKTYYSNLRAIEAMNLLKEGKSVEEVSTQLNFSSVNYFSLFFKKHFGKPPSHYKK